MGIITGVITGDKNNACNTCSCGDLVLPSGPAGPAGPTGPAGAPGTPGTGGGGMLIKKAQYFNVATGGTGTPSTWNDLYSWTFTPGAGEIYNADGGGIRLTFTVISCNSDAIPSRDPNMLWRLNNTTTGTTLYFTGDHSALPNSAYLHALQKHAFTLSWDQANGRWGGRVEIISADREANVCIDEGRLFDGNIVGATLEKVASNGFLLLNPPPSAFTFPAPQTFTIQYNSDGVLGHGVGATAVLSEFLAEMIPA